MSEVTHRKRVVIVGAAGRDFHNFNVVYRDDPDADVIAFTATQIPYIDDRTYPPSLAGPLYPKGIPIVPEEDLPDLVEQERVEEVVFSYSDVSHEHVMHIASIALAAGADFRLLGPVSTMLPSETPIVAICAARTGAGKSQTTRRVVEILLEADKRVVVLRHPMPYGDLEAQRAQRFETREDLTAANVTIEEREEFEPHIDAGTIVYCGVDYQEILTMAEKEADVIVWDGGNNDLSFLKPDVLITVVDPLRSGHESQYHPGEANVRMANVIVVNKCDSATPEQIAEIEANVARLNPIAKIIRAESPITVDDPDLIKGKRVLVVEDGPTLTHGGMEYGAGVVAARQAGATIVDPRPFAVGTIAETYAAYPETGAVLPAMGYSDEQIADLSATIDASDAEVVIIATPVDLRSIATYSKPAVRVRYDLAEIGPTTLKDALSRVL